MGIFPKGSGFRRFFFFGTGVHVCRLVCFISAPATRDLGSFNISLENEKRLEMGVEWRERF